MTKTIEFKTKGTCSSKVIVTVDDGIVTACKFVGGCSGNTQGVCALVKGMNVDEAIEKIKGIRCGFKNTSCPDQLALALEELKKQA